MFKQLIIRAALMELAVWDYDMQRFFLHTVLERLYVWWCVCV